MIIAAETRTELVIVGAGPAGMAAAEAALECGVDVTVIDEQRRPGGQIYRQPPPEFTVPNWLSASTYRAGKALLSRVAAHQQIRWRMQSTVAGLGSSRMGSSSKSNDKGRFTMVVDGPHGTEQLSADAVLIAPGCYDLPVNFPGWNLPGVMAAGGIQAFVKSQQLIPGERFLFVGTHPLQLVVADQIVQAGGNVAGVYFAQKRSRAWDMMRTPLTALRSFDKLAQTAGTLWRLRRAGVPVVFGHTLVQANGEQALRSVTVAPIDSAGKLRREKAREIACDRLGVCFSFVASSELARQAGAECQWDAARGGWIARHDDWMRSTEPDLYVAGEITGVAGSEVAALEGRLAGVGCALGLGRIDEARANEFSASTRQALQRKQQFASMLSQLSWPGFPLLDQLASETVTLCKCEEITVGAVQNALQENPHITTASAAKLLSRVGMGLCQGRYCHFSLTRLMAKQLGLTEDRIGPFTCRFPAKPVVIDALIGPESS